MGSTSPSPLQPGQEGELPSLSATNPIDGISQPPPLDETAGPQPKTKHFRPAFAEKRANEAIVRAAKAEIRSKLREDWEYPLPDRLPLMLLVTEHVSWVERESDDSPTSTSTEDVEFHNPDPFSSANGKPSDAAKKNRRREALIEEAEWNQGLQNFLARRDAWTGARQTSPAPPPVLHSSSEASMVSPTTSPTHMLKNHSHNSDIVTTPPSSTNSLTYEATMPSPATSNESLHHL